MGVRGRFRRRRWHRRCGRSIRLSAFGAVRGGVALRCSGVAGGTQIVCGAYSRSLRHRRLVGDTYGRSLRSNGAASGT